MTQPIKPLTHLKYRRDIDGLRALAVLSVVAFHAFPHWLKGGFIGVDIFFVISGYLISTILFENIDSGAFSFWEFYGRRIKRIFPALLVVLVACYSFGWFVLLASEYKQLAKHIAAGSAFISNLTLWNESGYFDSAAERKPLLHLWSLGIEEQFYIVWPLLLWLSRGLNRSYAVTMTAVMVISFALNVIYLNTDSVAAFYSPLSRFWELVCGGGVALIVLHESRQMPPSSERALDVKENVASAVGIAMLLCGISLLDKYTPFPGYWALVPVLGTALVIYAGSDAWCNRLLLGNPVMVWFGLISFPLYLWHWPLLSFTKIIEASNLAQAKNTRIFVVLLAILLAWLTYQLVERPFRLKSRGRSAVLGLLFTMIAVGAVGLITLTVNGLPERKVVAMNPRVAISEEDGGDGGFLSQPCPIAKPDRLLFEFCSEDRRGSVKYALIGDSKAGALYPGLVRTSTPAGRWLVIGGNGPHGPPIPILSTDPRFAGFQRLTRLSIVATANDPDIKTVVLTTSIRGLFGLSDQEKSVAKSVYNYQYLQDLDATSKTTYQPAYLGFRQAIVELIRGGKHVVLVVDNPPLPDPLDCAGRRTSIPFLNKALGLDTRGTHQDCYLPVGRFRQQITVYLKLLHALQAEFPQFIDIFDPTGIYCSETTVICGPSLEDHLVYAYTDHISDYTAGLVGQRLNAFLNQRQ